MSPRPDTYMHTSAGVWETVANQPVHMYTPVCIFTYIYIHVHYFLSALGRSHQGQQMACVQRHADAHSCDEGEGGVMSAVGATLLLSSVPIQLSLSLVEFLRGSKAAGLLKP